MERVARRLFEQTAFAPLFDEAIPSYHFDLLELRRLDGQLKADALSVIQWATRSAGHSYQPLYDATNRLLSRFNVGFDER